MLARQTVKWLFVVRGKGLESAIIERVVLVSGPRNVSTHLLTGRSISDSACLLLIAAICDPGQVILAPKRIDRMAH